MTRAGDYMEIFTLDGTAEAYVARPKARTAAPGVLLYMDAIGLRPQIERLADVIASWGYVVLAPNVFYREGRAVDIAPTIDLREPGAREAFFPTVMPLVANHTSKMAALDLAAYADTLLQLPEVRGTEFGITGYCMGGRLALRAGAQMPEQVVAIGMFHAGGLVTDAVDSPHLAVSRLRAEVVAGYADHDASMTPEHIATLDALLSGAGVRATTRVYEGAPHGYCMADTSMYDEQATERHYSALRALFARTLR